MACTLGHHWHLNTRAMLLQLSEETGPALGISWADNNTCNATVTA
jgi:hypothetical protein